VEARERTVQYYVARNGTQPFRDWRNSLTDTITKAAIDARIAGLRKGNFGVYRSVGGGAIESKIDLGPGYRIYFGVNGDDLVLLNGGDKSSQMEMLN
jgi:putative addiction module killer protein